MQLNSIPACYNIAHYYRDDTDMPPRDFYQRPPREERAERTSSSLFQPQEYSSHGFQRRFILNHLYSPGHYTIATSDRI